MSVLKLSEISDEELATRLLTTTGRLEPHCAELARRLLAWCEAEFLVDIQSERMERVYWCGEEGKSFEVPDHKITWCDGLFADEDEGEPYWWEEPAAGEA